MAKLTVIASTLVVLFALAAAFDFQTLFPASTIITKLKDEERQECRSQIGRELASSCQEYLRKSSTMSPYSALLMTNKGRSWREEFPRCCEQLEEIDRECRCEAVRQVVQQLRSESEEGEMRGVEMQEMLQTAQSLPNLCRMKPRRCHLWSAGSDRET